MFTGIVEEAGAIAQVEETDQGIRLSVETQLVGRDAKIGDSIALNGCCLTVIELRDLKGGKLLLFDLLRETWQRTNLHAATVGALVNLERSMPADGRIHGHFVTGHIDGTGKILQFDKRGADWYLKVQLPAELKRYLVFKGAVALDGISLTVAEVDPESFAVWIIPHTFAVTALRARRVGALLNLEADLLAKYVQKIVTA